MLIKEYIYSALQGVYPQEELKSLAQLINKDLLNLSEADTYIGKYINLSAEKKQFLEIYCNA